MSNSDEVISAEYRGVNLYHSEIIHTGHENPKVILGYICTGFAEGRH